MIIGIISNAQRAKIAAEDADFKERVEMVLVDAYAQMNDIDDMPGYLRSRLENEFKGETVSVTDFDNGYLILVGERIYSVDSDFSIGEVEKSNVMLSTSEDWQFAENSDGSATLTAYLLDLNGEIIIPGVVRNIETGKDYKVTAIGNDLFNYGTGITKIDFSNARALKTIKARAFAFCSNLEISLPDDLPKGITSIGDKAFYNCKKLEGNINTILNKGYTLGKGVFMKCPNLTGDIQNVFDQNFYLDDEGNPVATVIEEGQFSGYSGLTGTLTIPYYITAINDNAFYGCSSIQGLAFEDTEENPSECTVIGDYSFYGCSSVVNSLTLPDSILSLGEYTFYQCKISGLILPSFISLMGADCFGECDYIEGEVIIPYTLEALPTYCFYYCRKITSVSFETKVIDRKTYRM